MQRKSVSKVSKTRVARARNEDGAKMLIEERRQHIVALTQENGRVVIADLSQDLGISRLTIRKDLDYLQEIGILHRTHGGAVLRKSGALFDPPLKEKEGRQSKEKQRISIAAAELVQEGQCVLLDSGTTTMAVAKALKKFRHLTIVTNAVNIAAELAGTDFEIILTGGTLRKNSLSLVGPLAEETLRDMHVDFLFLGVDGFDLEIGLTTPNFLASRVNRAMVRAATTVVAVCDSTKFGRRSLSKIVDVTSIHHVITDNNLPTAVAEAIRGMNVKLTLV
jgi:DeoR family transcriptional regulator of aga operon